MSKASRRVTVRETPWLYTAMVALAGSAVTTGLAVANLHGTARLAVLAGGCASSALGAWLVAGPEAVWLEGDVLMRHGPLERTRLPLRQLVSVELSWVPYAEPDLVLRTHSGASVVLSDKSETTEELRRALGERLTQLRLTDVVRGEARELLHLPPRC